MGSNFFKNIIYSQFGIGDYGKDPTGDSNFDPIKALKDFLKATPDDIQALYNKYDEMDGESMDVSEFLSRAAEEATIKNKESEATIWVESDNETLKERANKTIKRLQLNERSTEVCRNIAKYGRWVQEPVYEHVGDSIRIVDLRENALSGMDLTTIQAVFGDKDYFREIFPLYSDTGKWKGYFSVSDNETYEPWDFIEYKVGAEPLGKSLLRSNYTFWKSLDLVERALEYHRVARSPQTNIYKVPTGNSDPQDKISAIKMFQRFIEQQVRRNSQGKEEKVSNPPSPITSIYWPVDDSGLGDVDIHSNDADISDIVDIERKDRKFRSNLGLPAEDENDPTKNLTSQNVSLLRKVEDVQRGFMRGVDRIIQIDLALIGIGVDENSYKIRMSRPSDIEEIQRLEKLQMSLDVADQLFRMGEDITKDEEEGQIWRQFVVEDFLENYFGDILDRFESYKIERNELGSDDATQITTKSKGKDKDGGKSRDILNEVRNKRREEGSEVEKDKFIEMSPYLYGHIPKAQDIKNF